MTIFKPNRRNRKGNMSILSIFCFGAVAVFVLLGASLSTTLFFRNQLQLFVDELARDGASKLNDLDRVGQINNLEVRCRQLIYSSREDSNKARASESDVNELASILLAEDRQTAKELENERNRLKALAINEAKSVISSEFQSKCGLYEVLFPWLKVQRPVIESVDLGSISGVESNATVLRDFPELCDFDQKQKVFSPKSNLYGGNLNVRLPGDDADLNFRLASLMAPVRGLISGARLVSSDLYTESTDSNIPSTVRIIISSSVNIPFQNEASGVMKLTGCATTCGASPNF